MIVIYKDIQTLTAVIDHLPHYFTPIYSSGFDEIGALIERLLRGHVLTLPVHVESQLSDLEPWPCDAGRIIGVVVPLVPEQSHPSQFPVPRRSIVDCYWLSTMNCRFCRHSTRPIARSPNMCRMSLAQ
jgi:hypothetical protein